MLLAAEANTPIRRLVINDIGAFTPLIALKRFGAYVGQNRAFDSVDEVEEYMREIYASFGHRSDENWRLLVRYGIRPLLEGKLGVSIARLKPRFLVQFLLIIDAPTLKRDDAPVQPCLPPFSILNSGIS
jgi:hypothetical protein